MATDTVSPTLPGGSGGSSRLFVGQVESLDPIMGDAMLVSVRVPRTVAQQLRPGRFFEITCRHESAFDPLLRRPFSVYRVDRERGSLAFLIRPFGRGSGWMARRKIGDELDVLGPLGNAYEIRPATRNLVLVAGGVGVAPMVMAAGASAKSQQAIGTSVMGGMIAVVVLALGFVPVFFVVVLNSAEWLRTRKARPAREAAPSEATVAPEHQA